MRLYMHILIYIFHTTGQTNLLPCADATQLVVHRVSDGPATTFDVAIAAKQKTAR